MWHFDKFDRGFYCNKVLHLIFCIQNPRRKKKRSQSCYANHRCAFQTKPLAKIPKKRELKIAVINLSHDRKRSRNFVADGNAIRSKAFFFVSVCLNFMVEHIARSRKHIFIIFLLLFALNWITALMMSMDMEWECWGQKLC